MTASLIILSWSHHEISFTGWGVILLVLLICALGSRS